MVVGIGFDHPPGLTRRRRREGARQGGNPAAVACLGGLGRLGCTTAREPGILELRFLGLAASGRQHAMQHRHLWVSLLGVWKNL